MRTALDLDARRVARCARMLEYAPATALLPHLLVLATLLPDRIEGSESLSQRLAYVVAALRDRCERLFVRYPDAVEADDLEDPELRYAMCALGNELLAHDPPDTPTRAAGVRIAGAIAKDRLEALLPSVQSADRGSALPWIFAAELMGDAIVAGGARSDAIGRYRSCLLERLCALADQSPQVFRMLLVRGDEPQLRDELRALTDALRGAFAVATA